MKKGQERRWRFVHDDRTGRGEGHWRWNVGDRMGASIASLGRFATLDECIADARRSGFSFAHPYEIVFARSEQPRAAAG